MLRMRTRLCHWRQTDNENARSSFRNAIKTEVFAAITKYYQFVGREGWDGEVEEPKQDGAIFVDGGALAEHLRERFVIDRDVDTTCMIHYKLLVDLPLLASKA
jgi:hypothetical protein